MLIQDCGPVGRMFGSFEPLIQPLLSSAIMSVAMPTCLTLFMQAIRFAVSLAAFNAGKSNAARIEMMATTTKSSIRVNDFRACLRQSFGWQAKSSISVNPALGGMNAMLFFRFGLIRQRFREITHLIIN